MGGWFRCPLVLGTPSPSPSPSPSCCRLLRASVAVRTKQRRVRARCTTPSAPLRSRPPRPRHDPAQAICSFCLCPRCICPRMGTRQTADDAVAPLPPRPPASNMTSPKPFVRFVFVRAVFVHEWAHDRRPTARRGSAAQSISQHPLLPEPFVLVCARYSFHGSRPGAGEHLNALSCLSVRSMFPPLRFPRHIVGDGFRPGAGAPERAVS